MSINAAEACERIRGASWIIAAADARLLQEWAPAEPPTGLRIAGFAHSVAKFVKSIAPDDLRKLMEAAEACLIDGDETVRKAMATCFFEPLQLDAEQRLYDFAALEPFMGPASRDCCRAIARFRGSGSRGYVGRQEVA